MKAVQSEINIGVVGHVDHGKTSLVKSITGEWADRHSEEIKRGITIRLGYADADIYECKVKGKKQYILSNKCPDGSKATFVRRISFVDCPGHENLMSVTLSGASLMDAAILVIAANEECPRPQTQEHLSALEIAGIKHIIVVQNKIDLVDKKEAMQNYRQIKQFVKGTIAENAPIIPVSANYNVNIDAVIDAIQRYFPTPKRDASKALRMYVARSFDVNRPKSNIEELVGGVLGGTIAQGVLKVGDEIEIKPGIKLGDEYKALKTKVVSLSASKGKLTEAKPGGLIGVATTLDPALTKSDNLVGNVVGKIGELPDVLYDINVEVHFLDRVVEKIEKKIEENEVVVVNAGTTTTVGTVLQKKGNEVRIRLKKPLCIERGHKVAISQRFRNRWSLTSYGVIK